MADALGPGHEGDDGGDLITNINVTPMVDIMLVLLIIFMVTATFIVRPSIKVELPKASSAEKSVATVGVTLLAGGGLLLNGRPTTEKQLYSRLKRQALSKQDTQAIIAGDAAVPHGRVVRVIDIIRRAGVTRFAINVQIEEGALSGIED
jgi:biopolymer transport protein ExbD